MEFSRCLSLSLCLPGLILTSCLCFLYPVAFQIFFLRLPLCSSVYLVLNSSLWFLYPVAFKIVFLCLPLSISLSLNLPSLSRTLPLCTSSFCVSLFLSPWPYLLVLAYVSGTLLLFEVQLPVSSFYFLVSFFSPITLGFFPLPCLVSVFLSRWSLPPLSPAPPPLIYSSLSRSLFFCSVSPLSSLYPLVLLPVPLWFAASRFPAPCPTPLPPSVLPPAFLFPFLPLSCCLWALSLVAKALPGLPMCLKEETFPASSVPLAVFAAPGCRAPGCGQVQGRG